MRTPIALFTSGLLTYAFNLAVLRPIYYADMKELGLDKYMHLDLNADMMKQDLEDLGIRIKAKYYNQEEIEERLDREQESMRADSKSTK